jgi:alkylhydroperoxidase family enzyme
MSRLPKMTREGFPEDIRYVWDRVTGGTGAANIFAAIGNNPRVLHGYLRFGNALWDHCGLDVRTREMVILRAAYLQNSAYEWHQHVRIGRQAGLDAATINAIRNWRESDRLGDGEKALLGWADGLAASSHPNDALFGEMKKHFDDATVAGVTFLVLYYFATTRFLAATEVEIEEPFVGWTVVD